MKIIPLQGFILVRMQNLPTEGGIELPQGTVIEPYGVIVAVGPQVVNHKIGDKILFLAQNAIGHDKGGDERYIIPQSCIYATCDPDQTQDGGERSKLVMMNPPKDNPDAQP